MDDEKLIKYNYHYLSAGQSSSPPDLVPQRPLGNGSQTTIKARKDRTSWPRIVLTIYLLLLLLGGGGIAYGYYYFNSNIQAPLGKIYHSVSLGKNEPTTNSNATRDTGVISGRSWNILLLGSDDDEKYVFPSVLTQVIMVIHIDTVNNSVYMVSIPRDSWVYVPEIGGMHKIDQAFEFAAKQNHSFDDGVRVARLTIEKGYGIK